MFDWRYNGEIKDIERPQIYQTLVSTRILVLAGVAPPFETPQIQKQLKVTKTKLKQQYQTKLPINNTKRKYNKSFHIEHASN